MLANSSSSFLHLLNECFLPEINFITLSLLLADIVTMPLFVSVLVLGYQKWRKQRLTTMSHIDVFTYNVVVLNLIDVLGTFCYYSGSVTKQEAAWKAGISIFILFTPGETLFHLLTCVERYLAVVYPVVYLHLRGSCGVRIRNAIVGCVWLISCGVLVLVTWLNADFTIITILLLFITSMAFGFCSLSVLCALIRPGPGEGGGDKERDQSKQRAFNTMMVITGALSLRFLSNLIITTIQSASQPYGYRYCLAGWSSVWFFVPSSLVLPLLFLQREGRLPGCGPRSDESA